MMNCHDCGKGGWGRIGIWNACGSFSVRLLISQLEARQRARERKHTAGTLQW